MWQQVADLRPQLRHGVEILVQDYRGERWYLLHDQGSGRFVRFNTVAYEFLGRLDGDLSVQEIFELANAGKEDEDVLEREDILQVLAQLHGAEVLRGALPLGARDLLNRYHQRQRFRRYRALSNPLALRIPLFDPDRFLGALIGPARWLFSGSGFMLWLFVVVAAAVTAMAHADELVAAVGSKALSTHEVLAFWLLFPLIKALHELGHGLAVKSWGGEVHEMGINLLVFMPVPFVDASAAWALRDKRRRALVGAAGIMVELFLAAVAFMVWLVVEPGLVRELALDVALIGSVSSLFFNGNPLLRFDGYYVLEDLIEIPNLASRSSRFYQYLFQKHLLGLSDARSPATAPGETAWFAVYGMAAPVYRLGVLAGIALYLAAEFLVVGVVLATWAVFMQIVRPAYLSLRFIASSPRVEARRIRGFAVIALALGVVVAAISLPAPLVTRAQGVVWPAEQARVVNPVEGFVSEVIVISGETVSPGMVLLKLDDRELRANRARLEARLQELRDERAAQRQNSRVRAAMVTDDIEATLSELEQTQQKLRDVTVRSAIDGVFYALDPFELKGKLLRQGDVIGVVVRPENPLIRAVVDQDGIGLLRSRETAAEVMLSGNLGTPLPATIVREVPAGSTELPSMALGAAAGGSVAVDMHDEAGRTATEKLFHIELSLPHGTMVSGVGERAYVRLSHGREALWQQWSRSIRQLLLSALQT